VRDAAAAQTVDNVGTGVRDAAAAQTVDNVGTGVRDAAAAQTVDNVGTGVRDAAAAQTVSGEGEVANAGQDVGPASDPTPVLHEGPAEPSAPAAVPEPDTQT